MCWNLPRKKDTMVIAITVNNNFDDFVAQSTIFVNKKEWSLMSEKEKQDKVNSEVLELVDIKWEVTEEI